MKSYKRKMTLVAVGAIFIATFGFASISTATDGNSGHDKHSVMQKDKDGKVSKDEFMQHHRWMFQKSDANKDGFLDKAEMKVLHKMEEKMHERFEATFNQ